MRRWAKAKFYVTRVAKKWDRERGVFEFDIRFKTVAPLTDRTVAVSDAFGLGIDEEHEHVVYDRFTVRIGPRDVVYITGDSGSGKSVLLRAIEQDLGSLAANLTDIEVVEGEPIIETVGETFEEALRILSFVGLNDAFIWLRPYEELSDGQKYRYRLAKLIESGRQYWIADEFCSTLDRDTAKVVAYNFQKAARRMGRAVIVATCHTDLFEDLHPSVYIRKGWGPDVEVKYYPNEPAPACSLMKEIRVEEGSRRDWLELSPLHYRGSKNIPTLKVFRAVRGNRTVGVIVYSPPPTIAFGRVKFLKSLGVKAGRLSKGYLRWLSKNVIRISRVVVHPKYRGIGLGVRLIKETMPLTGYPIVEMIAVMARYNPFAEKAGMVKVAERKPARKVMKVVEELRRYGFNPVEMASKKANLEKLRAMTPEELEEVADILCRLDPIYAPALTTLDSETLKRCSLRLWLLQDLRNLAHALMRLQQLTNTTVYLAWRNPDVPLEPFPGGGEHG